VSGLIRAFQAVGREPAGRWSATRLAALAGLSPVALRRASTALLGLTPNQYVAACRRGRFFSELSNGRRLADAIYTAGYSSPSAVYRAPGGSLTPAVYRRGAAGVAIEWTTVASPVGRLLVAATSKGVCFVAVGADDAELRAAVEREFPRAILSQGSSKRLRELAAATEAVAAGRPVHASVPADIAGTAFQWRVWTALMKIKPGQTITYRELAKRVGQPQSIRAAARACATNPLALVIPCHRVVGSDGALRGYRWGVGVKKALIEKELAVKNVE
jgi:AraC family transcriptional regulator of adaptative response/methylated-DNA-[protein]-cysteine methyltransferase